MNGRFVKIGAVLLAASLLLISGCDAVIGRAVKTELYFGMLKGNGHEVSEHQWQRFVNEEIGPRLEGGFTIVDARGRWVGKEEVLIKEKTKIVIIIHPDGMKAESAIKQIRDKYKEMFEQEEVLRISNYVRSN